MLWRLMVSLRGAKRRSNPLGRAHAPEDCFAVLAMTAWPLPVTAEALWLRLGPIPDTDCPLCPAPSAWLALPFYRPKIPTGHLIHDGFAAACHQPLSRS